MRIFSRFYVTYLLMTLWYLQVYLILPCHSWTAFFLSFAYRDSYSIIVLALNCFSLRISLRQPKKRSKMDM
jgi:hypothetical protein